MNISLKIENDWSIQNKNKTLKKSVTLSHGFVDYKGNKLACKIYSSKDDTFYVVDEMQKSYYLSNFNYRSNFYTRNGDEFKSSGSHFVFSLETPRNVDFTGVLGNAKLISDLGKMYMSIAPKTPNRQLKTPLVMVNISKIKSVSNLIPEYVNVVSIDNNLTIDFDINELDYKPYVFASANKPFLISKDRPVIDSHVVLGVRVFFTFYMVTNDMIKKMKSSGVIEIG
jgi:hypothetical protein